MGLNYKDISKISIDGHEKTEIYVTIGSDQNMANNNLSALGKGMFSVAGLDLLDKLTLNSETGSNKVGLNPTMFSAISAGAKRAVESFSQGVPSIAMGLLNAVFGGATTPVSQVVSLKADANISLNGQSSSSGAVPSTPIDMKIPGTVIQQGATGFVPLYNEPLGVFYWDGDVTVDIVESVSIHQEEDDIMFTGTYDVEERRAYVVDQDYSQFLIINPAVKKVADVSVISQEVFGLSRNSHLESFPMEGTIYHSPWKSSTPIPDINGVCIKILLKVKPKNGAPASYLCKTFKADNYRWRVEWR